MNLPKNSYLHLILVVLIPLTIIKSESQQQKKIVLTTFTELQKQEPYLLLNNTQLSSAQEYQFQTDLYDLRLNAKNSPVQVIHFQPEPSMQKTIDDCTAQQFNNDDCQTFMQRLIYHPITVKVPSNLRSVTMILHSDVPIHWQFDKGNQRAKALFFTGILPSSIISSQFSGNAPKFFSFQYHSTCEFGPMCRMTQINFLQKYTSEYQYKEKVKMLLDKDVDKFITLTQ